MNRQTKRMLQRQGQLGADGAPAARRPSSAGAAARRAPEGERASVGARFAQYLRSVRTELRQVLWPKRAEVVNYSTVVFTTLVILALVIFGLNYLFARGVGFLFRT